jgi:Zn-finger nucleic acid-binding protein
MKCPVCEVDLNLAERHGIEIDYCPKCRGVWLDRGELDKIIERADREYGPGRSRGGATGFEEPRDEGRARDPREQYDDPHHGGEPKKKRKKPTSFLSDIFEGFGE